MKRRIFFTALTLAFTGAVAPGPMLVLVVGQVMAGGVFAVIPVLVGHALIEVVYVTLLARGVGERLRREPLRSVSVLLGGGVLVWFGAMTIFSAPEASIAGNADMAMNWWALVVAGIGVSLSNPYFTGWWATVGSGQLAALDVHRKGEYSLFMLGHELGDVLWYGFVACVLGVGRQYLTDSVYRWVVLVCGALVLVLGLVFIGLGLRSAWRKGRTDSRAASK